MEEKKSIFSYISRCFETYGILVVIFMIFSSIVGEGAAEYSPLFSLGKQGLSRATLLELLLLAVLITVAYSIFMSDNLIKNMRIPLRTALYLVAVTACIIVMIFVFGWFPKNDVKAWVGFVISYILSLGVSVLITSIRERMENNRMQEALDKYNKSN
ncbi:Protein of unknown function [Lachnospiraceae bacterium NE2001]|nr:Protein of unknown function [Lachnospiraceae bacterium NE2001]